MSWNYRIVRTYHEMPDGTTETMVGIHEVHYDQDGNPNGWTADVVAPTAETWEEFQKVFAQYSSATAAGPLRILDERELALRLNATGKKL